MTALVLSWFGGVLIGTAITLATVIVWARTRCCPEPDAHNLTEADRQKFATELAAHASAVRLQVSKHADLLAGGDAVLRERLRPFELRQVQREVSEDVG